MGRLVAGYPKQECGACMSMLNIDFKVYKGESYVSVFFLCGKIYPLK